MRPTKQLIRGLRETAQKLREGAEYCWYSADRCNCGLLAQTLLDVNEAGLHAMHGGFLGSWTFAAERLVVCTQTGLPVAQLFKVLMENGVEYEDYKRIEHLDSSSSSAFENPAKVAAWMDAEADKLEARRAAGEKT